VSGRLGAREQPAKTNKVAARPLTQQVCFITDLRKPTDASQENQKSAILLRGWKELVGKNPAECRGSRVANHSAKPQNYPVFKPGQAVRVNLAGMQVQGVMFHAAVTDAVGNIIRQTSENPPAFLVKLLFSFKGVTEVEVPAERIRAM
jgi:hypothetical protein